MLENFLKNDDLTLIFDVDYNMEVVKKKRNDTSYIYHQTVYLNNRPVYWQESQDTIPSYTDTGLTRGYIAIYCDTIRKNSRLCII